VIELGVTVVDACESSDCCVVEASLVADGVAEGEVLAVLEGEPGTDADCEFEDVGTTTGVDTTDVEALVSVEDTVAGADVGA